MTASSGARLRPGTIWRIAASRLRLLPIQRILADAERHGTAIEQLRALEVFGYTGERVTRYYAPLVRSVEVWEPHRLVPRRVGLYFLAMKVKATEPRPGNGTSAP